MRFSLLIALLLLLPLTALASPIQLATFEADVTPPLGTPLCGGAVPPAKEITDPLSARGMVLLVENQQPIVLCAVDWVGIGGTGHTAWREALAQAAKTTPDRVAIHCLHQHDAPTCDFEVEELLAANGLSGASFDPAFAREAIAHTAASVADSLKNSTPITHLGTGEAEVMQVASNRRVLGADGKVEHIRWSATTDEKARAREVGTIDPKVKLVSFWNGTTPVAVLSFYATHPQSHYGKGAVTCDFPGLARNLRQAEMPETLLVHFNGAGGNITAGKYNTGEPANRAVLTQRLADGMRRAWQSTTKVEIAADQVSWKSVPVVLPARAEVKEEEQLATLENAQANERERVRAASELSWLRRTQSGDPILLTSLKLGTAQIIGLPGELFIEYQLAAQTLAPNDFIAVAAYADYAPGYIGTTISYTQGGYETGLYVSRTAPEVEPVLMEGIKQLISR